MHSTARKHAAPDVVDAAQCGRTVQTTCFSDGMMISLLAAPMMIDMNGPDIEAVDEVKALILESVNTCIGIVRFCIPS